MKRLKEMTDEVERQRCSKCNYLDPSVPMTEKKALCGPLGFDHMMNCEIFLRTNRLESRMRYIRGEISATIYCSRGHADAGCHFDTYQPEDEDKVPFYCPVDTCPEYNEKVCPKRCNRDPELKQQSMFDR